MRIHPSILSSDFANLELELQRIETADAAHIDVMDGHFVPNLTIGLPVVRRLGEVSPIPLDVHLMIENPDELAPQYAVPGVESITFHFEAARDAVGIASAIRDAGAAPAVAIKPGTEARVVTDIIDAFDMVLVMTVEPGFGGQSFMPEVLPKLVELRSAAAEAGTIVRLQVDGGVDAVTIVDAALAGADTFVAGSAVYGGNPAERIASLRASLGDTLDG
ncbi:ribulose-phosphate 3-epimerase [uncultured Agrococcus sp.]|uniref:ribulose-phosphate 3-epimerase n=1 Tax=uncultured Agrococcus sp. TaxID=382258 RepID=UPI0025F372AE|nr:ribulose-phosphate 3-epimerase [uncultured Agrococcus sp.]